MELQRAGHDWVTNTFTPVFPSGARGKRLTCQWKRHMKHRPNFWVGRNPWRRKWQPTQVFLFRESHGQRSLVGYSPLGWKELDTTETSWHACIGLISRFLCNIYIFQYQTLLSPPDTSILEHHFHFGLATSLFLKLLVIVFWSSPIAYWTPSNSREHIFWCHIILLLYCAWALMARILGWVAISCPGGPCFIRTLHYDLSILGGPAWHGS